MTGLSRWISLVAAALILAGAGCAGTAPPPPPMKAEVRSAKPHPRAKWVPGHWKWKGRRNGYVWVRGHWQVQ